jgi:hypothetical protein
MRLMNSAPWFVFFLASLAVWRISHLFQAEDGPFDIFFRLRRWLGNSIFGKLLDCFYCLSIWIAVPAAWLVGRDWSERLLLWLALSATAILVECVHAGLSAWTKSLTLPPIYHEAPLPPEGGHDELLRK